MTEYEKMDDAHKVKFLHRDFFKRASHVHIPDIRPGLIQLTSGPPNIWRYIREELEGLLFLEGEEEKEEKELWYLLVERKPVWDYIDEKREIADRFISKYTYIFLVFLKSDDGVLPLLSSCRDVFLFRHDYLLTELHNYTHNPLFMRNLRLTQKSSFHGNLYELTPIYGKISSSLLVHASLYHAHQSRLIQTFKTSFGNILTMATLRARIALIEIFSSDMRITEIALCFLVLARDCKSNCKFLSSLIENTLFRNTLSDERISYPIDSTKTRLTICGWSIYTENHINILLVQLIEDIIGTWNKNLLRLYSPFINMDKYGCHFENKIMDSILKRPISKLSETKDFILFLLYDIPHTQIIRQILHKLSSNAYLCHRDRYFFILDLIPQLSDGDIEGWYNHIESREREGSYWVPENKIVLSVKQEYEKRK